MKRAALLAPLAWLAGALAAAAADDLPGQPFGQFAFVPHRRQFRLTPLYQYARSEQFYDDAGHTFSYPGSQTLRQQTGALLVEYGLAPYLAADATLSAVASQGPSASGLGTVSTRGLGDTQFGLRWRLLDEDLKESEPFVPTLTFRLGGIAPGTYDAELPFAPGAGAAGLETRLMMSDTLGASPVSLYGEVGWRWFAGSVPDAFFGSAGAGVTLPLQGTIRSVAANLGYAFSQSTSGGSVGVPDALAWSTTDWRELNALSRELQAGLALTDQGGRRYQFFARLALDGRNAPRQTTFGFYVEIPFAKLPRRRSLW